MTKKVLIPLPLTDFDPTEVAVPWKILSAEDIEVVFATTSGLEAQCDQIMLTGKGLGILAPLLQTDPFGQRAYGEMSASKEFKHPRQWAELDENDFDGIILPGGHGKGMMEYLESDILKRLIVNFFTHEKPVGAICHGVLLVARSQYSNNRSVLFGRKTTSLLAGQELGAWALTCLWMQSYYRTYRRTVESEVRSHLASQSDFIKGTFPLFRDNPEHLEHGFTVCDKNYLSARWPGDAHLFANRFLDLMRKQP